MLSQTQFLVVIIAIYMFPTQGCKSIHSQLSQTLRLKQTKKQHLKTFFRSYLKLFEEVETKIRFTFSSATGVSH